MPQDNQQWIGTLVSFGVLALVLALRMRRMRQLRPLRIEQLWMLPAFYAVVLIALYVLHPPHGLVWLYALVALAVGTGIGWYRGKLMTVHVDPQTHEVSQQGSLLAMLFILVVVGMRFAARSLAASEAGGNPAVMISVTDVLLAFGLGFIGAQRIEMGLRAKMLLAKAKSGTP